MTQRERLIKLISDMQDGGSKQGDHVMHTERISNEKLADHLLDNGVILPPCKVGDTAWLTVWWGANCTLVELTKPEQRKVMYFALTKDGLDVHFKDGAWNVNAFNNFIFLTREQAEKALKERGNNDNK